ncbi:exo-polygalacturonase [Microdochium trichocladiopsis]|uniref:galacturonan 1,4-alpha-galacturonidase n=1 Tax=Microdochium trichocladiopsis TaxID=1682393 RepID=A0A9P9BIS0_9PEZI|nr:exo-polygalacturonase [Microdochium trichocladiopsis]KAH7024533.1 exo-polygalacturonase [Microdochium trichocladiopsis]
MHFSQLLLPLAVLADAILSSNVVLPAGVPRDVVEFREKHPYRSPKPDCHRKVVTIRSSKDDLDDVADEFLQGIKNANNGGTLRLEKNKLYVIGKPLDLTFLNDIHVDLQGEILFTNDTSYWQANAFHHPFQNSIMFWKWGGSQIKIYGDGILNGNGQRWYNEFAGLEILDPSNSYLRPILMYVENATDISIKGIHQKNSPCWTNFVVTSKNIEFENVMVTAHSNNASALPKNTDMFDSLNIENLRVKQVWVDIGDDCFSPKSNASNVHVDTMYCNGTHGQSIGSLGQYEGEKSFVEDVVIENVWLLNGQHGARLKTWAGEHVGYGYINNVTFRNFWQAANEYASYVDSCYFNIPTDVCAQYPSKMNLTNILFENFTGYTSGKYGRAVARLTCSSSPDAVCENIQFKNFQIETPCGNKEPVIICDGIKGGLGVPCVPYNSTEAKAALADKCTVPAATTTVQPWH